MRKPKSEEHNRKNSESHKGIKQTKEDKRKKSISMKAYWDEKKKNHTNIPGRKDSKETRSKKSQKSLAYWKKVHAGLLPAPKRKTKMKGETKWTALTSKFSKTERSP